MNPLRNLRRLTATSLLAALISLSLPAISSAGGCDEPGYTGGCVNRSCDPPLPFVPLPEKPPLPADPTYHESSILQSWLVWILAGLIR